MTPPLHDPKLKKDKLDCVTSTELDELEAIKKVLEPLFTATEMLCTESKPTISLILPIIAQLRAQLNSNQEDSTNVKETKQAILNDLQRRYQDENIHRILLSTTFLDQRFKNLPFASESEKDQVFEKLKHEAAKHFTTATIVVENPEAPTLTHEAEQPVEKKTKYDTMTSFFGGFFEQPEDQH